MISCFASVEAESQRSRDLLTATQKQRLVLGQNGGHLPCTAHAPPRRIPPMEVSRVSEKQQRTPPASPGKRASGR